MRRFLLAVALLFLVTDPAAAHKPSDAYLRLDVDPSGAVQGSLDLALRDLELVVGLDGNGDGAITWGELRARHPAIDAYVQSRLLLRTRGGPCALRPVEHLVDKHTDGAYAVLRFTADCPAATDGRLTLRYGLLFDIDPMHRGLLTRAGSAGVSAAVLSPDRPEISIEAQAGAGRSGGFGSFFVLGAEHLASGLDHVLFLLVLLLPVAYHRAPNGAWLPVVGWSAAAAAIVKILSAFTVAHGVSLAAAATGLVDLPSRLVESAIAATIVLAALDNLRPYLPGKRWLVAFGFGLIHGLGFASALGPLDLPPLGLVVALLGFNLGIEAAQVLIALCFLAATYPLRTLGVYARGLLPVGSAGALVVAGLWFIDRAFALAMMPF
jgi:HupE / UreJ protein